MLGLNFWVSMLIGGGILAVIVALLYWWIWRYRNR